MLRLWWPRHHSTPETRSLFLVGWTGLSHDGASFDVVVATTSAPRNDLQLPMDASVLGSLNPQDQYQEDLPDTWITASMDKQGGLWIPKVDTFVHQGRIYTPVKYLVILYDQPTLGHHNFARRKWDFFPSLNPSQSNNELRPEESLHIETVLKQLNCAAFVENQIHSPALLQVVSSSPNIFLLFMAFLYNTIGQACFFLLHLPALRCLPAISYTFDVLQTRLHKFSIWRSVLFVASERPFHPNVAVAQRITLSRHSLTSKLVVDLGLGAALGCFILLQQAQITATVSSIMQSVTNDVLKTGCVWLMGAPAGFKLNNDLAGVIGTASLDIIQAFSTMWRYVLPLSGLPCKAVALISIAFGATVSAAFVADLLFVATVHIAFLQHITALLYRYHLKALVALWRLFSGRKHNVLRGRIDSYDYTVEKLVVASLAFAPLLLLLPTSSIFYIFFTIIHVATSTPRLFFRTFSATLNWFPYAEVWMWLAGCHNFPSGLQFNVSPNQGTHVVVVESTITAFGQLILPFLTRLYHHFKSSCSAYQMANGERFFLDFEFT